MKKALKSLFSVVIMLSIVLISQSTASAASEKNSVYSYLTNELGFSCAAACGIMANIEKESNFDPTQVARDSNGLLSGGLCMWNGSRFASLKKYCNQKGYSYLSVKGQLSYLGHELNSSYYKHIYNYLKKVPNTAQGAYDAAHYWCYYFEIPKNRATSAVKRGNLAKSTYWNNYSANELSPVKLTCPDNNKTVSLAESIKLSWNNAGKSVKSYTLYLAKYKDGKADFAKAQKIRLSAKTFSKTLKLSELGKGKYSAYVLAQGKTKSVKSNKIVFTAKCLNHIYTSKITKAKADTANGVREYTCKLCGEKIKQTIDSKAVTPEVKAFGVVSCKTNSVSFKLSFPKGVSGFECYKFDGEKWVKVNTLPSNKGSVTIGGLSSGKIYKFRFRAFTDTNDKTLYSEYKTISVPTATESVTLTSVSRPAAKTAGLSWKKVSGADGYEVFRSDSKDGEYKRVKTVDSSQTSCEIKGLTSGEYYYFKVRAINKSGSITAYSAFSKVKYIIAK